MDGACRIGHGGASPLQWDPAHSVTYCGTVPPRCSEAARPLLTIACTALGQAPAGLPGSVSGRSPALRAARTRLGPLAGDSPRASATVTVGLGLWEATAS